MVALLCAHRLPVSMQMFITAIILPTAVYITILCAESINVQVLV